VRPSRFGAGPRRPPRVAQSKNLPMLVDVANISDLVMVEVLDGCLVRVHARPCWPDRTAGAP